MSRVATSAGVPAPLVPFVTDPITPESLTWYATTTFIGAVPYTHATVAHSKGSWVEMIASTSADLNGLGMFLSANNSNGVNTSALLDIGIGTAGNEVAVVENVPIGQWNSDLYKLDLPVHIPRGSRVAVRVQGAQLNAPKTVYVQHALKRLDGRPAPRKLITENADISISTGAVSIYPAGTGAKSAWTQIVAATTMPYQALIVWMGPDNATTYGTASALLVDIGIGASGSETVISYNQRVYFSSSEAILGDRYRIVYGHFPKGTRIAARGQRNNASTAVRPVIIGIPYA